MKSAFVLLLGLSFVLFGSNPAVALSVDCSRVTIPTATGTLENSGTSFYGKILQIGETTWDHFPGKQKDDGKTPAQSGYEDTYADIKIDRLYKGPFNEGDTLRVFYNARRGATLSGERLITYTVGEENLFFATNYQNDRWHLRNSSFGNPCNIKWTKEDTIKLLDDDRDIVVELMTDARDSKGDLSTYIPLMAHLEKNKDYGRILAFSTYGLSLNKPETLSEEFLRRYARAAYEYKDYTLALSIAQKMTSLGYDSTTLTQLSQIYLGNSKVLNGQKLKLADQKLNKVKISDGAFIGSDFTNTSFNEVTFENADVSTSSFKDARFYRSIAKNTDFSKSDFSRSTAPELNENGIRNYRNNKDIVFSDCENCNFSGSNFTNARIAVEKAANNIFSGANFTNAAVRSLPNSKINDAIFTGTVFSSDYDDGQLQNLDFSGLSFDNNNFYGADLSGSSFQGASLRNVNFRSTILKDVDFNGADLTGSNFFNTSPHADQITDISGATFSNAKIDNVVWGNTTYDCSTIFPTGFSPQVHGLASTKNCGTGTMDASWSAMLSPTAHYRLTNVGWLRNLDLENASFEGRELNRFETSTIKNTNFKYTKGELVLDRTNLEGADFSYSKLKRIFFLQKDAVPNEALKNAKFHCARIDYIAAENTESDLSALNFEGLIVGSSNTKGWPYPSVNPIKSRVIYRNMPEIISLYGPADYNGMDLTNCNLFRIDFGTTNLKGAKFKGAFLDGTDFSSALLDGADFKGARLFESTKFPVGFNSGIHKFIFTKTINEMGAPWEASSRELGSSVVSLYIRESPVFVHDFPGEDFSKMQMNSSWLPGTDMSESNLEMANFQASNFVGAKLKKIKAKGAVFFDALLIDADLAGADLQGADFRKADLTRAILTEANLKNALYDSKTVWPEGFDPDAVNAYYYDMDNYKNHSNAEKPWEPLATLTKKKKHDEPKPEPQKVEKSYKDRLEERLSKIKTLEELIALRTEYLTIGDPSDPLSAFHKNENIQRINKFQKEKFDSPQVTQ